MLAEDQLKDVIHEKSLSNSARVLLCLAVDNFSPKAVKDILRIAVASGLRRAKKWNISSLLNSTDGKAIRTDNGWELSLAGRTFVGQIVGPLAGAPAPKMAVTLRALLPSLKNSDVSSFVEEAIQCLELRLFRSAVVLSWVGAIAVLQDHIASHELVAFNAEALRRDAKWRTAKTSDDLGRMKEHDFLQVLEAISVLGRNTKQELEKQLKLRNGCGHPNSFKLGENTVAAHIEVLSLNVFSVFCS